MIYLISSIIIHYITAPQMPTAAEINILRQLKELLKPLEYVTKEALGHKYITISKIIPMVNCLMTQLNQINLVVKEICKIKDLMYAQLVKRFGQIEFVSHIAIATLLDQRFKNLHFKDSVACFRVIATLRKYMRIEIESSEFEKEGFQIKNTYDF